MKIGFIAMSGVRAHNEELMEIGLNLPGFVERSKTIASLPSLGLLTLAALTPDEFDIEYHEVEDFRDPVPLPEDYDLVAISSFSAQIWEAYDVAKHYSDRGIPVVMGGLHVTSVPDEALQYCTTVVIGEGEPVWPTLLEDFKAGSLKNRYQQDAPYDLSEAPIPRFDLLDPHKYNRITIQTSRGCPWSCEFCASSILISPRYKVKPVDKVIQELEAVKKIWDRPFIEFADDNSFVNHTYSKELARALIPYNIAWFTETDLSVAEDDELLALLRESGCKQILIGLESPRKESVNGLELQNNWKLDQVDKYAEAIKKIQSYGITVNGCFVFGLDGDTQEVFDDVYSFLRETGLFEIQITYLTPFPGTPLYDRLKKEKRLMKEEAWELCTLFDPNVKPKNMSLDELNKGFLNLGIKIYSGEETTYRRKRFYRQLLTSPNMPLNLKWKVAKKMSRRMFKGN